MSSVVRSVSPAGVKEQTAGTYAAKLAGEGFVTIAYDASYQGEKCGPAVQLKIESGRAR
jgi:fermentation-respiration switch protein FrsA (DUF1100 family)